MTGGLRPRKKHGGQGRCGCCTRFVDIHLGSSSCCWNEFSKLRHPAEIFRESKHNVSHFTGKLEAGSLDLVGGYFQGDKITSTGIAHV